MVHWYKQGPEHPAAWLAHVCERPRRGGDGHYAAGGAGGEVYGGRVGDGAAGAGADRRHGGGEAALHAGEEARWPRRRR